MYCVITGDMINSRKMSSKEREDIGILARRTFDKINGEYRDYLLSGFDFARGDGFEAVLLAQYKAPKIIQEIIKAFYPVCRLRISVALGELVWQGDADHVNAMDGPAFLVATDALSGLKKIKSDHWLQLSISTGKQAQLLVDAMLSLLTALTSHWTEKQREVVWSMERLGGNKDKLAEEIGVTVNAIRKHLKVASYDSYRRAWVALEEYLVNIDKDLITTSNEKPSYISYLNVAYRNLELHELNLAEKHARDALKMAEAEFGSNDPRLAPVLNTLAAILLAANQFQETVTVCERSISVQDGLATGREDMQGALAYLAVAQFSLGNEPIANEIMSELKAITTAIKGKGVNPLCVSSSCR